MTNLSDSDLLVIGKRVHDLFDDEYRSHVSVYGVGWPDGTIEDLNHYYCHMALMKRSTYGGTSKQVRLIKGRGPCVISNQVQYNYNDDGRPLTISER